MWNDVKGFEGLYQVSDRGEVKRVEHYSKYKTTGTKLMPERIKTQGIDRNGYKTVMLYKGTSKKLCKVHRLVAEAFIDNPNSLPQVNHIDENKTNNKVNNLEWCDAKYNNNYGTRNIRMAASKMHHPCYSLKDSKTGKFIKKEGE